MSDDKTLTAANVQRVLQGVLDAANELMTEFVSKKRAAKWDIINQGLYEVEVLNGQLRERLRKVGVAPTESRSK